MLGSPLLNNDFECIGLVMGANGMDCNNKGPIYFETLANSKAKNTSVYQLLTGGNTTVDHVDGMKLVPCYFELTINANVTSNIIKKASYKISSNSKIDANKNVLFRSGVYIDLLPGFETEGNTFEARIQDCDYESKNILLKSVSIFNGQSTESNSKEKINFKTIIEIDKEDFLTYPTILEEDNSISVYYYTEEISDISIHLIDFNGKVLETLYKGQVQITLNKKFVLNSNIASGIYIVRLENKEKVFTSKIIKQ